MITNFNQPVHSRHWKAGSCPSRRTPVHRSLVRIPSFITSLRRFLKFIQGLSCSCLGLPFGKTLLLWAPVHIGCRQLLTATWCPVPGLRVRVRSACVQSKAEEVEKYCTIYMIEHIVLDKLNRCVACILRVICINKSVRERVTTKRRYYALRDFNDWD